MITVKFPIHLENSRGEESWSCTATLTRDRGRYWLDSFSAKFGERQFDSAGQFCVYAAGSGSRLLFQGDILSAALDALEQQSTWRDDLAEVAAARADHLRDEMRGREAGL